MKKRINLLLKTKDYEKKEKLFQSFRRFTLIFSLIVFTLSFVFFYISFTTQQKINKISKEKSKYLNSIIKNKKTESKLSLLNQKTKTIKEYSKKDLNFLKYYNIIQQVLKTLPLPKSSTESSGLNPQSSINNFSLNNQRETQFSISAPDFDTYLKVLDNIENKTFLDVFSTLTLAGFNFNKQDNQHYSLNFKGKFSPKYENN